MKAVSCAPQFLGKFFGGRISQFSRGLLSSKASFDWRDAFNLDGQLSDEERAIRDSTAEYCTEQLMPRITNDFRNEGWVLFECL